MRHTQVFDLFPNVNGAQKARTEMKRRAGSRNHAKAVPRANIQKR